MNTYTTVGGYAALIGIGGLIYVISQRKTAKGPRTKLSTKQTKAAVTEKEKPAKAKKARKDSIQNGGDQDGNRSDKASKKPEKLAPQVTSTTKPIATTSTIEDNDEIDNREFARQLSSAKSGTLLKAKTSEASRQKSVKQSKAQEKPAVIETSSAPSSAAGGDADDDRSPLNSPELGAAADDTPVTSGGISDMLESASSGPSVLKITAPTNPTQPKKSKAPVSFEPAETKKQRQNRKKAELRKAEREAEEKDRKVALEKQRRTAREAEGRAAKDGSLFMASKAPASSAWTAPPSPPSSPEAKEIKPTSASKVDLLDTYEPASNKAGASSKAESGEWQKIASSLSEEDQLRIAMEESDNWETVPVKGNKKKSKSTPQVTQAVPEQKKENVKMEQERNYGPPEVIAPTGPGQEWNMTLSAKLDNGDRVEWNTEVQDSEWDVAGYGP